MNDIFFGVAVGLSGFVVIVSFLRRLMPDRFSDHIKKDH
jgi:hypothetical protein